MTNFKYQFEYSSSHSMSEHNSLRISQYCEDTIECPVSFIKMKTEIIKWKNYKRINSKRLSLIPPTKTMIYCI